MREFEPGGRRISRESLGERIEDPETGEVLCSESVRETVEMPDGSIETHDRMSRVLLACGHLARPGQHVCRCDACSRERGRTTFVCGACSVQCPGCGRLLCVRHTRPGGDGKRYCPRCKGGWGLGVALPRGLGGLRGLLSRFLEWW